MSIPENSTETREELLAKLIRSEKDLSRVSLMFRSVIASQFGLNVTDAECVDYLIDAGPMPAGRLAELTGLTNSAITSVIDRLEITGLVKRQPDRRDRRKVIVAVVQEKVDAIAAVYRPTVMKVLALYSTYSDEQIRFLLRYSEQMRQIYQEGIDPEQ